MSKTIKVNLESTVTNYITEIPSYGVYCGGEGFKADKTLFSSESLEQYAYPESLGSYTYCLKEGTLSEDWQSGVGAKIDFKSIKQYEHQDAMKWIVSYSPGEYFINEKIIRLNSETSYSIKAESEIVEIEESVKDVSVALWFRDKDRIKKPYKYFPEVDSLDSSNKKFCYVKNENSLVFRRGSFVKSIGTDEFSEETWESKGKSNGGFRLLYSKYFPIQNKSLRVFATNGTSTIEYKESKNIYLEEEKGYYYRVDEDLGVIEIGFRDLNDLILKESVNSLSTSIKVLNSMDLENYPESGFLVTPNGESLYYEQKGRASLEGVVYYGADVLEGSSLKIRNNTRKVNSTYSFYIRYNAVPRIDIEDDISDSRIANISSGRGSYLDLKPSSNINNSGVVQLSTKDKHVLKLNLRLEGAELVGEDYYEGVFYGSSYCRAIARAIDSEGEGVEDVQIYIAIESGPGFLNGGKQYTDYSNLNGEIEAGYYAPYDWEDIKKDVISSEYKSSSTIFQVETLPLNLSNEEVQIYEVLKNDHNVGTRGELLKIESANYFYNNPNGSIDQTTYIRVLKSNSENFDDIYSFSKVSIKHSNGTGWIDEKVERILEDEDSWYIFLKKKYNATSILNIGDRCFAFIKGSLEWSPNSKRGLCRVLYNWNERAIHPITQEEGAYYPIRPISIRGNSVEYNLALREPDPYDPEEVLGDYIILTAGMATMYAWCVDPFTGQTIVSNRVRVKISIPRYLNGVDFTQALPVPYGFRIRDQVDDVSSGIGGINFLSINPLVENKLSLGLKFI